MRAFLALAFALAPCCTAAPAPSPAPVQAEAAAAEPFSGTRAEVLAHIEQLAPTCPEHVAVEVAGGVDKAFCQQACAVLNRQTGAWCHRYEVQDGQLDIDIRYTDFCLMLAVHEGRLPASRLSAAQTKAFAKAQEIVAEAKAAHSDEAELALALHDRLALDSRYSKRISSDGHVCSLLLHGEGLCECYAGTYYLLARMAGLECLCIEGKTKGTGHEWNLVRLGGEWVHVDCTYDDPVPDKPGKVQRHYFGMDDATIAKSHHWERKAYPACTSDRHWYPREHTPRFATLDEMAAAVIAKADETGTKVTMEGYVEEVAKKPKRGKSLLRAAVNKHRRSLLMEQDKDSAVAGFITLTCEGGKPTGQAPRATGQKRKTP